MTKYTIKKLADMAGVSVRTLHYYDQIDLLKPSFVEENGYRNYGQKELLRLQQILFYREMEMPLEEIKKIMDDPAFDVESALEDHRKLLEMKRNRIDQLIKTIDKTLTKGNTMKDEELFEGFDEKKMKEYAKEAKERWGETAAYKQSMKQTKNWTKEDILKISKEWDAIARAYADKMEKGFDSPEIQAVVQTHWNQIDKFYDCTTEIFKGLADMYVADERFAKNYTKYHKNLPEFVQKAMHYFYNQK